MPRPKTNLNRADQIIEAAMELFSRYGYERTSIEDISKHLGIGKGSVYLEFRTKEEILFAIIDRFAESIRAIVEDKIDNPVDTPLNTLRDIIKMCCLAVYDRVTRDIHTPESLLHTSIQMKIRFRPFYAQKRARYLKLLKMAADAGEIAHSAASEDTVVSILMAVSSLSPPYINNYTEQETRITRDELERRCDSILNILLDGLRATKNAETSSKVIAPSGNTGTKHRRAPSKVANREQEKTGPQEKNKKTAVRRP